MVSVRGNVLVFIDAGLSTRTTATPSWDGAESDSSPGPSPTPGTGSTRLDCRIDKIRLQTLEVYHGCKSGCPDQAGIK